MIMMMMIRKKTVMMMMIMNLMNMIMMIIMMMMMMMSWFQEENLHEVHLSLEAELESAEQRMRDTLDQLHQGKWKSGRIQH